MKYSASDLVKRSSAQIIYLRDKLQDIVTWRMQQGMEYQSKVVKDASLANVVADEMRGCYAYDDVEIYFCIDMIKNGDFYEVKSILDKEGNNTTTFDEWYLNNSILQCAFYKSLLLKMEGDRLYTPKFRINEGYKKISMQIDKQSPYFLIFGEVGTYQIEVLNPDKIINFYKKKVNSLTDYTSAREFDSKYKHKEFNILKPYFRYSKIDN